MKLKRNNKWVNHYPAHHQKKRKKREKHLLCSPVCFFAYLINSTIMTLPTKTNYIGRFAPSPTGLLHIGSLIGAVASYLDAKSHQGKWLVRMEDLDPPREISGAAHAILQSLDDHGLHWDKEVLWQSRRLEAYQQTLSELVANKQAFYCTCSRNDLKASHGIYQGNCRGHSQIPNSDHTIRLQVDNTNITFNDAIQGHFSQRLETEVGDVVLKRKDGLFAYQLAVVVDDHHQGINHVVRGSDLLDSTPRQIHLQKTLLLPLPEYAHTPIITDHRGHKLSKQTFAKPLLANNACANLLVALEFLNQPLPPEDLSQRTKDIIHWSVSHWALPDIPKALAITEF
jgi:glutamyl-Q tRNA(Asp) synthetase